MGQKLKVGWQETATELRKRYRQERHCERRTRLHALWQLRCGKSLKEVAVLVGIAYRTLQYWVAWYREGGLAEVLERIKGHGRQGRPSPLKPLQQKALATKVALGTLHTVWDVLQWVEGRWKVRYSYGGLYKQVKHLNCRPKVPRPRSIKAEAHFIAKPHMLGRVNLSFLQGFTQAAGLPLGLGCDIGFDGTRTGYFWPTIQAFQPLV